MLNYNIEEEERKRTMKGEENSHSEKNGSFFLKRRRGEGRRKWIL